MNIYAVTVGRNESGRYLRQVVEWTLTFVDRYLYVDDGSLDDSMDVAIAAGATAVGHSGNRFLDSESEVREEAWKHIDTLLAPRKGDWIMSIDADELVVANHRQPEREALEADIVAAMEAGADSLEFDVHEVFGWNDDDEPMCRVDGFWNQITARRAACWTGETVFADVDMGGGSLPEAFRSPRRSNRLALLHLGYARPEDREAKAARYAARPGVHNPKHIASILQKPTLQPWRGRLPWAR